MKNFVPMILTIVLLAACSAPVSTPASIFTPTSVVLRKPVMETPVSSPTAELHLENTAVVEIKNFPMCTLEEFDKCEVDVEDLFNGNYLRWLQETQSKPFNPAKVKEPTFFRGSLIGWEGDAIWSDAITGKKNSDPASIPFHRFTTSAVAYVDGPDGVRYPYLILPVEFYNKEDPEHGYWVLVAESYYAPDRNISVDTIIEGIQKDDIPAWKNTISIPISTSVRPPNLIVDDPLATRTFSAFPDMNERFESFISGELGVLSEPGIVLLTWLDPFDGPVF